MPCTKLVLVVEAGNNPWVLVGKAETLSRHCGFTRGQPVPNGLILVQLGGKIEERYEGEFVTVTVRGNKLTGGSVVLEVNAECAS